MLRLASLLAVIAVVAAGCAAGDSDPDLLEEFVAYRTEIGAEEPQLEQYFSRSALEYWVSALIYASDPAELEINAGRIRRGHAEIAAEVQQIHDYSIRKIAADRQVLVLTATVDQPPRAVLFSFFYVYEAGAWRIEKSEKDMLAKDLNTDQTLLDFSQMN